MVDAARGDPCHPQHSGSLVVIERCAKRHLQTLDALLGTELGTSP
jgi:hypothetical protein